VRAVPFSDSNMSIDIRNLAYALGGKVIGRNQVAAPGPGHRSRKDKSLVVKLDDRAPDGFVVISFAGDSWQECKDHVRQRLGLPAWQPGDEQDRRIPSSRIAEWDRSAVDSETNEAPRAWTEDEIKRINAARNIWAAAKDPRGTIADVYLRQHRKLELTDQLAGSVLRFHPAVPWRDEDTGDAIQVPALIAAFRSIDNNQITAIHRIALNADGSKHGRRMLGIVERAAIKLAMPDYGELAVAEGVETALAATQLGFKPAWALGSCGAISRLPVIDGIERLTLLGENDSANADAVKTCGDRWLRAGRNVLIAMPDDEYNDLNDELMARAP
jgi:putative DNA primase/helicase